MKKTKFGDEAFKKLNYALIFTESLL